MGNKMCIVADDQAEMRNLLELIFKRLGFDVKTACDGESLRTTLQSSREHSNDVQFVVTDLCMPGCKGFEALEWAKTWVPNAAIILITAFGTEQTHRQALHYGASKVIDKPFSLTALKQAVQDVLTHRT